MNWTLEEDNEYILNYMTLAGVILNKCELTDINKSLKILRDKEEENTRLKEIDSIRNAGGKTRLEIELPLDKKKENKGRSKKVYLLNIGNDERKTFKTRKECSESIKISLNQFKNLDKEKIKLIDYKYIISDEPIKIKKLNDIYASDYDTSYCPDGYYYRENYNSTKCYSIIGKLGKANVKVHDCKEAAIEFLLKELVKIYV